ncbi:apolipoprotein N-acyltransferase [Pseudoprimorskyibacter insulae]|uniref:Apolipoprotein N-acyltransferase n=1 Tax=Pseudoprimorskyibacter insulae TaxID=1695997 RepID=A0A2R8AYB3_9RHOB|nr:apolipoprotein N-acyltransferase [Pseudoprimorskyibacter insulae]SPF81022.1 Apolipoprotein N-acyltransferase [Pseudoprimorskyibacter insulae]
MRVSRISLASLGAGGAFALGQPPFGLWPVALLGLVAGFAVLRRAANARHAAMLAWLFGLGYFGLSLTWIVEPFFVDAADTGWMAPFALIGMAGGLALFWGVAGWAGQRLGGKGWFAVTWALVELARSYMLTGFPWGLVGYVWADTWALQWVAFIGAQGLTLVSLGLAALASAGRKGAAMAAIGAAGLLIGGYALRPAAALPKADAPVVRLIQPNAPQHLKWDPDHIPTFFQRQLTYTRAEPRPDLVVWPETSLPMWLHDADEALSIMSDAANGAPIAVGVQRYNFETAQTFNSMLLLDEGGQQSAIYDKHHLVPFGEYMPAAWLFDRFNILGLASRAEGGYSAGPGPQAYDLPGVGRILPLICYEAVFQQDLRLDGARPDLVLHLTNDAWFGTFSGPYQHLQQARVRAVEFGLPVLRAANTGVSAVIDPAGRVLQSLDLGQAGYLDAPLPAPRATTVYAKIGDWPVVLLLIALSLAGLAMSLRNRH